MIFAELVRSRHFRVLKERYGMATALEIIKGRNDRANCDIAKWEKLLARATAVRQG